MLGGLWLVIPNLAQAQFDGPQEWKGNCVEYDNVATVQGLGCLLANILSVAITGIGFVGFVMLLVGAFRYLVSGGNSKGTETARNTVTYAVIGLIVALSSFVILNLIAQFTGVETILNFIIPSSDRNL